METVSIGISLTKCKDLHRQLGEQIRDTEIRVENGSSGDGGIELRFDAQSNDRPQAPVEIVISNDDMERDAIRDSILVDVS